MQIELPSGTPAHLAASDGAARGLVGVDDVVDGGGGVDAEAGEREQLAALALLGRRAVEDAEAHLGQDLPGADDPEGGPRRFAALGANVDDRLLGDAVAAADATGCEAVGLIGFCMGGMYALKASASGRFDRIAAFYGMIKVPEQWQGPGHREPLDYLVRRGDTQVMEIVGTVDNWTPDDHVAELEAAGVTVVRYEGADHGFVHDPSRPVHRPDDAADAWDRVLAFLDGTPT